MYQKWMQSRQARRIRDFEIMTQCSCHKHTQKKRERNYRVNRVLKSVFLKHSSKCRRISEIMFYIKLNRFVLSEFKPSIPQKVITIAHRRKLTGVDVFQKFLTTHMLFMTDGDMSGQQAPALENPPSLQKKEIIHIVLSL